MDTPCVEWSGQIDRDGYGRLSGRLAHRLAYATAHGPIPEGMTVDHLCFNPPCVRVDHLRLLTRSENCSNQRRAFSTHCTNGHEYTPENTYDKSGDPSTKSGKRVCRACNRAAVRRYTARKRAA